MNIFVGSLPFSIDEADLRESFEAYGTVDSVKIITDKFTGRSKGFGFVEMSNDDEAQKAIDELNGATVEGRTIVVNKSEPKPEGKENHITTTVQVAVVIVVVETLAVEETEEDTSLYSKINTKAISIEVAFLFFVDN